MEPRLSRTVVKTASAPPGAFRVVALLQQLEQRFGAQELGQIIQTLFALTLRKSGFEVLKNSVGVPDLVASKPASSEGYSIEVKTGKTRITLSDRDLAGVLSSARTPIVAAMFLSDPSPHWLLTDARSLKPGSYRRFELEAKPKASLGFDVTEEFQRTLLKNHAVSMEGPASLARLLASA
jgi:hypothetical protein